MDLELKEAACSGNVDFLRSVVGLKPIDEYFLTKLSPMDENIFHLATRCEQSEFLELATEILPEQVQQKLHSQKDKNGCTPLHMAAGLKQSRQISLKTVKLILGFYKSGVPVTNKPWLEHNQNGYTPLHLAIEVVNEESAMEILSMDVESLCMMVDKKENDSALFLAVKNGCNKVAEKILLSSYSYSLRGKDGSTPLHFAPNSSGMSEFLGF
uniref:Uncharacterized protein n=1 Tax=Chenopodium quinoa TaxID=63459 RepID=A0A803NCZ0_CHEQI